MKKILWIDVFYVYDRKDVNWIEVIKKGMKLKDIFYIGVLKVKLFYEKIINVLILYGFCFLVFIYGFVDIYSFFILWLKIVEVINNM